MFKIRLDRVLGRLVQTVLLPSGNDFPCCLIPLDASSVTPFWPCKLNHSLNCLETLKVVREKEREREKVAGKQEEEGEEKRREEKRREEKRREEKRREEKRREEKRTKCSVCV
ncbi:hypothetical protein llap_945 [Limosa lapponica baueri]|uniref:Uncharacterized protein n=1 Tax=Limosa lapponica baueri TaxID=1758121 RepID=A0A2I0URU8_LIMLA|nr:hypothetical protein llap_945 [Limosa lapponica baueri]